MANNLFVTYDLIKTKNYPAVYEAIKSLGVAVKVTESNWYVNSHYNSEQAAQIVREGANKQVISSQADSLIKISRIWADFFPANTSNQPI